MVKRPSPARKPTTLTQAHLSAIHKDFPKSRHNHPFAPDVVPSAFHTLIDPDKSPPQPWRDLPQATGLPPYRMALDSILDQATIKTITDSGKLVFHSVGDT